MDVFTERDLLKESDALIDEHQDHQRLGTSLNVEVRDIKARLDDWHEENRGFEQRIARLEVRMRGSRLHQSVLDFMKDVDIERLPDEAEPVEPESVRQPRERPAGTPPARPHRPPARPGKPKDL